MTQIINDSTINRRGTPDPSELLVVDRVEGELRKIISKTDAKLPRERDLADQYGVSRQSVRHAIARLKKEKLLRSIRGKGTFVVSKAQRQTTVHLIANPLTMRGLYGMTFISVLSEVLRERGYSAHIVTTSSPVEQWKELASGSDHAEGGILVGPIFREKLLQMVSAGTLPLVHVSDMDEEFRTPPVCDTVLNDNTALSYRATEHLIRQGHRRIAILGWSRLRVWDHEMYRGYSDAMRHHGLEPNPDWHVRMPVAIYPEEAKVLREKAHRQVDRWLSEGDGPTAMIHTGDDELRMRESIEEDLRGYFPPESVIVMSFWEMLLNSYRGKTDAAAVVCRFRDMAGRAVELLVRRREEKGPPTREFHGRVFLVRRENGLWQEETPAGAML